MSFYRRSHETYKHVLIGFVLLFAFLPLYVMLAISLKDNDQFLNSPMSITFPLHWENWTEGWKLVSAYIANSIVVSVLSVVFTLTFSISSAYVFAKYSFRGKALLWYGLIALLFMPGIMNLVPLFVLMRELNLLNSLLGLTTLFTAGGQVFCIFVLRTSIEDIPEDLFEAAEIDGAGELQQIFNIVLPMCASIISTLAILRFLDSWNSFVEPMIFISDGHKQLLPVALMRLDGEYIKMWGQLMAGFSIAAIPTVVLFIFSMRLFVKGLTAGALKG